MSETVDDFMKRFGGGGTVDDEDAVRFHDRFISTRPEDSQFDNGPISGPRRNISGNFPTTNSATQPEMPLPKRRRRKRRDFLAPYWAP
jgi:hypothetical protein